MVRTETDPHVEQDVFFAGQEREIEQLEMAGQAMTEPIQALQDELRWVRDGLVGQVVRLIPHLDFGNRLNRHDRDSDVITTTPETIAVRGVLLAVAGPD